MYATPKYPPNRTSVIGSEIQGIGGLLLKQISQIEKKRLRMWIVTCIHAGETQIESRRVDAGRGTYIVSEWRTSGNRQGESNKRL